MSKTISQVTSKAGEPVGAATSAPGWFIDNGPLSGYEQTQWGETFSPPRSGNKVNFYTTGKDYFKDIASAIENANSVIFITGWQVNYDVILDEQKTLYDCLQKAVNKGCFIYIMPWLSPKAGVDTGDFETLLAISQLNAGKDKDYAFVLPAIAQSDKSSGLAVGFSHHQKLVVIDNKKAFVGGIDLAYGRRDDGKYRLAADGRKGNEIYNTCIVPVGKIDNVDKKYYTTRAELIAACFEGTIASATQYITSSTDKLAPMWDVVDSSKEIINEKKAQLDEALSNINLMPDFIRQLQDRVVDDIQEKSVWAWEYLNKSLVDTISNLQKTDSGHAANTASIMIAWLNNSSLDKIPPEYYESTRKTLEALVIGISMALYSQANRRKTPYKILKMLPKSAVAIDDKTQPRMPWHDVHSNIVGPSVYDLSQNFIRRWNSVAKRYQNSSSALYKDPVASKILNAIGAKVTPKNTPFIPEIHHLKTPAKADGTCWVQVLRSAPKRLRQDEALALKDKIVPTMAQNNCLKAMLTAIKSAEKFLYIEGQFFQSDYGQGDDGIASGPMAALLDIRKSRGYIKYAKMLGIYNVPNSQLLKYLIWKKVDDVMQDKEGPEFIHDLKTVMNNQVAIEISKKLGKEQKSLLNPIGYAIANRIEKAIKDDLPFHVYLVIPVHPEGTLNTLNIMTQQHLTMQSLVYGKQSVINEVCRAMLIMEACKKDKLSWAAAKVVIEKLPQDVFDEKKSEVVWNKYLTLLNLRNWEMINKMPVTEQIYVHSKLLIADDRVAILGSANINDRSMMGDGDSELAVIIRDDNPVHIKLDGKNPVPVSLCVHQLRSKLWKKIFGLAGGETPASDLASVIEQPINPATWKRIQDIAQANLKAYQTAFLFTPQSDLKINSIWPTWDKASMRMHSRMPFDPAFWRVQTAIDRKSLHSWDAPKNVIEKKPQGVQGFIVALPIGWLKDENNLSGINLTLLADNQAPDHSTTIAMQSQPPTVTG